MIQTARWSSASPRRWTATWSSWARTAAWSSLQSPSCPTGRAGPRPGLRTTAGPPRGRRPSAVEEGSSTSWPTSPRTSCVTRPGWPRSCGCPGAQRRRVGVEPRGYRLLHRLPRFSDAIIERIVDRFVNLADHASVDRRSRGGRGLDAARPLGQGRAGPTGRGEHLRALPVAGRRHPAGRAPARSAGRRPAGGPGAGRMDASPRRPDVAHQPRSARNARRNGVRHR